uniref:probable G-protein coupled receptor 139 n=1 Tax=Pristiophorus japonicus TaxID=55135 RepID=UPI00398F5EB0
MGRDLGADNTFKGFGEKKEVGVVLDPLATGPRQARVVARVQWPPHIKRTHAEAISTPSERQERRSIIVARELRCFDIDIATLSETQQSDITTDTWESLATARPRWRNSIQEDVELLESQCKEHDEAKAQAAEGARGKQHHRPLHSTNIQKIYYPLLAVVGVPANSMTILILSRGKCGLSKCVTRYLVAMAAADLLVVITDLILRQIPIVHRLYFVRGIPVCNIHAVLLYVATDCSVWFTVTFTFDRFVAICCQKLKTKYCTEKTAAVVLGAVTVLSCLKNIFWYFMYLPWYTFANTPWFCYVSVLVMISRLWGTLELLHSILTPCIPFVLILLLNASTIRHILVASRVRRRLQNHSSEGIASDIEMERRRKSIILLLIISGNFILLWAVFMLFSIWKRLSYFVLDTIHLPAYMKELGFMLQLLSCCTNTCIYAVTQNKFREQLKNMVKCPYLRFVKIIKW